MQRIWAKVISLAVILAALLSGCNVSDILGGIRAVATTVPQILGTAVPILETRIPEIATRLPELLGTPVPGTPQAGETVYLSPVCNCRQEVGEDQPIVIRWGWEAATRDLAEANAQVMAVELLLDGQPIPNIDAYRSQARPSVSGYYVVAWEVPLGRLQLGLHRAQLHATSQESFSDGFDANGDGQPDTYGPGEIFAGWVEIDALVR